MYIVKAIVNFYVISLYTLPQKQQTIVQICLHNKQLENWDDCESDDYIDQFYNSYHGTTDYDEIPHSSPLILYIVLTSLNTSNSYNDFNKFKQINLTKISYVPTRFMR